MQAPQLIRKYHVMHPLEDKRLAKIARTISSTPTSQPTWLLNTNHRSTFNDAKAIAAAIIVKTAEPSSPSTHAQPPPNLSTSLHSLYAHSFGTPPSIPHIN